MPLRSLVRRAAGLCCALTFACAAGGAAAAAGRLAAARGTILVERDGQAPRVIARGATLEAGDTLNVPAAGFAFVVLADDSRIVLRPGTMFRIEAFATTGNGTAWFELIRGGLRALTGAIAKRNPGAVRFRTTVATIGIRGTAFDARLCGADCAAENAALGANGDIAPGLYTTVRTGAIALDRDGVVLDVPAGRAARAASDGSALLETVPGFLNQDPTPLPESDATSLAAFSPAPGTDGFYSECTVDGTPVFGTLAAQVADNGGESGANFTAGIGTTLASGPDGVARIDGDAQARAGAVPAATNFAGAGAGGPPPGTRLNANPGRPPGSNLAPGGGDAGAPREYTGNVNRAAPAQLSERAQRYRNEQENTADIVYREQDAVRDHMRATTTEVLKELGREGGDAYAAVFEIARKEGASKMEAAQRASDAIDRKRREVVDQALLNQLVANGTVDAAAVSGVDPTTALEFGLGLEAKAQGAGLKSGKALTQALTEEELDALRDRLRKNPKDVEGASLDVAKAGFVGEFGMSPAEMMHRMRIEGGPPGGQADSGGDKSQQRAGGGTAAGNGSPGGGTIGMGGANSDARGSPGRNDGGGSNERPASNGGGQTSAGAGGPSTPRSETPSPTGANGGTGGNSSFPPGDYVSVTSNGDGSYTVTQFQIGNGGTVERSTSETFTPNGTGGYTGDAGGHSAGRPPDGDYALTYGEQNPDGSTNISLAPVGGGNGGTQNAGSDGQDAGGQDQNDNSGGQNDQQNANGEQKNDDTNNDNAECSGDTCNDGGDAGGGNEDPPAESTDEGGGGRPNPMADDPVNTAMEIYLDVVLNGGRGTRQQMRAIEVAAGGGVTDPGDDPNATGAGGSTSFTLDLKHIGVKGGGGVDGTRAERDPEMFNPLDLDLIKLRSGGAVTDPPREGEDSGGAAPVVVGAGGAPGVVGPVPALRESTRSDLAPAALGAAIETSTNLRNSGAR